MIEMSARAYLEEDIKTVAWQSEKGSARRRIAPYRPMRPKVETGYWISRTGADVEYRQVEAAIQRSEYLLNLRDDWDGEGSPGYSQSAWSTAVELVRSVHVIANRARAVRIGVPVISPAHSGTIDIFWENNNRNLLANVSSLTTLVAFHGKSGASGESISGEVEQHKDPARFLAQWLMTR